MQYPNPNLIYPIKDIKRTCYLKNIIKNTNQIIIGEYTYYDDPESVYNFEKNVLYLFPFLSDKLIIGKFCQIASGVKFIMNGANHSTAGFSTYPFGVFGESWSIAPIEGIIKGDTFVGNDVWLGNSATIMPGVNIGHGSIIAANAVVVKDVEPYSIIGGNPGKLIKKRFEDNIIKDLLEISWWDWPISTITQSLTYITQADIKSLKQVQH